MATLPKAFREMSARQRGRVLVIDDDRAIRELLSLHLGNRGYAVDTAEDAIVGGKLALRAKPQLIIVDVNMPYLPRGEARRVRVPHQADHGGPAARGRGARDLAA